MSEEKSDKKLNRFSTIVEIITNLGTIGSWILGAGSAYVLNIQKFPVVVPGIDIALDLNFQFALIVCALLAYIHFLQSYWKRNKEKLFLADSFTDFSFWELPRLKQPLLLIPITIILVVSIQISAKSDWLVSILLLILGITAYSIITRFKYNLSPHRKYEILMQRWSNDYEWLERWIKRISPKLETYGYVKVSDLYEVGIGSNERADIEIGFALGEYFEKYEFEQDLVLLRTSRLPTAHPESTYYRDDDQWILLKRDKLNLGSG